ncbi:MAG: hypothetical protein DDT22_00997 [candidate division WS2 bacterium]|nr:hypothetical protein [Candidatus Lithacetigena glycinireducens]
MVCKIGKIEEISWPKNIKIVDVRKGLPFKDGSVEAIFSSHMLEHMTYEEANSILKECYRCLMPKGVIRIIVSDLFQIAKKYVDLIIATPKAEYSHTFLQELSMLDTTFKGMRKVLYKMFSHSRHLYMYDEWSLRELLEKHGFTEIQKMDYGQSRISDIKVVEDKGRHEMAVCLEGIKE